MKAIHTLARLVLENQWGKVGEIQREISGTNICTAFENCVFPCPNMISIEDRFSRIGNRNIYT